MKKIFTLVSLAAVALTANAQKITWSVAEGEGADAALKSVIVTNEDKSQASVFEVTEGPVTIKGVSGPVAGYKDAEGLTPGSPAPELEANYDNSWSGLKTQADCEKGPFYYVQGKGNPVDLSKVAVEEVMTEGEPTGRFRAVWDNSYYALDGSNGLCSNGTYMTLTSTEAGKMTAVVWINKGDRDFYVVPVSTKVALTPDQVSIAGYVNGQNNGADPAQKKFFDVKKDGDLVYISYDAVEKNDAIIYLARHHAWEDDTFTTDKGQLAKQAMFLYVSWDAAAGETYYIFNKNTQIGIGGFEFEGSVDAINTVKTQNANAAVSYNLAGQKVSANYNGIIVKGGKKFIK